MKIVVSQFNKQLGEYNILNEDILNGGVIYIGREEDCHIQLDSQQISRHHLTIEKNNEAIHFDVLSNYGGVRLNGNDVSNGTLNEHDKLEIQDYILQISEVPELRVAPVMEQEASEEETPAYAEETVVMPDEEEGSDLSDFKEMDEEDLEYPDVEGSSGVEASVELEENLSENEELQTEAADNETEEEQVAEENNFEEADGFNGNEFGDDGFGDDSFGDDGGFGTDSNAGESTQVIKTFARFYLKLFGEFAPFDRYTITDDETFIGRDTEKCQIILSDPEVSKIHAVIKKTAMSCTLEDLDSSNGIIHNGERVNKVDISNGDEFLIGDTSFSVHVSSDIIEAEKDFLMPVEENQEIEIEEIVEEEIDFDSFDGDGVVGNEEDAKPRNKFEQLKYDIKNDPKKKRMAIGVLIVFLILMFMPDDEPQIAISKKDKAKKTKVKKQQKKLSPEVLEKLEQNYELALAKFQDGEYYQAKEYLDVVISQRPDFKDSQTLAKLIQEGIDELIRTKAAEAEAKEKRERLLKIKALLEKAKEATDKREVQIARGYFGQILELDPENIDVPQLKIIIDAHEAEELRKKQEKDIAAAKRQAMVDKLSPGKRFYLKAEWYKAIIRLENFLSEKGMDEDLIAEATKMLQESKKNLLVVINPLISKARSFKEGQDLKQSYETFGEVLRVDPTNEEALNERDEIFIILTNRSKKLYREALVAESLSLYSKAKEKLQEVQQISPINSEYYNKASEKLKNYLE